MAVAGSLAGQLMAELQRLRAGSGTPALAARRFAQAIDASVNAPGAARRPAAASRYRIGPCVFAALDGAAACPCAPAARQLKAVLPEIVRQVARVEAGMTVATLTLARPDGGMAG